VHRLYALGGAAVAPMRAEFPDAVVGDSISRTALKQIIAADGTVLARIEAIVHPLVAADRQAFLSKTETDIAVLDIPLLFENGYDTAMDATVCVTAPPDVQRARIRARETMSDAQMDVILAKQMPDAEKRARATWVITTDTLEHARAQVQVIARTIRQDIPHA
jgi:dephospho-CoA kinase